MLAILAKENNCFDFYVYQRKISFKINSNGEEIKNIQIARGNISFDHSVCKVLLPRKCSCKSFAEFVWPPWSIMVCTDRRISRLTEFFKSRYTRHNKIELILRLRNCPYKTRFHVEADLLVTSYPWCLSCFFASLLPGSRYLCSKASFRSKFLR